ncbi:hypothetical protein V5L74_003272 [Enterobacter hormaechei]
MKKKKTKETQVIDLSELSHYGKMKEANNMKCKCISIDGYRKIHRAQNVSFNMHLLIRRQEVDAMPLLWIPDVFSYIADDIRDISEELKARGLYDEWLRKERNNSENK